MSTENRYAWLFRRLPVIATLLDAEGRLTDVSDEWVNRLGYSRDEILGRSPQDIATPESAKQIREEHLPLIRHTGRLDHVPVDFIAKDGEKIEMLATTISEYEENGRFMHALSVFTELSDRGSLERRYRDLYQSTPAMLHTIDTEGRITAVSDHWLNNLGYTREDVIGRSILDFMSKASREPLLDGRVKDIIAAGPRKNVPREMVTKNGEILDVVMSARAEKDPLTGMSSLLVASKDVTDRNRAESKLREAYGEIAHLKDELERERDYLREEVSVAMNFGRIVGKSPALVSMIARIEAVADTPASVLIIGETGTGKELVAHAIHTRSGRADGPLVKVNCASIPNELFESEFFGHVRGAYTGAHQDRIGRFQLADGGTIFLDEVGDIPLPLQGKLLRVLQEKEFERVGEDRSRKVDVRVIAATNKDLEKAVDAGEFREDLYYRLSVFLVESPPLRDRREDVPLLSAFFISDLSARLGKSILAVNQASMDRLMSYDWPGNIRELRNLLERAAILCEGETLDVEEILGAVVDANSAADGPDRSLKGDLQAVERARILRALEESGWKIKGDNNAASRLGLNPSTWRARMKKLEIGSSEYSPGNPGTPERCVTWATC